MSDSDQLARRKQRAAILFEEIIINNRLELADEVFVPNFYWPQFDLTGPEGVHEWVRAFRTAFPDMDDRVQEQIAGGDIVVTRVCCIGIRDGLLHGLPPSGKRTDSTAIDIDRFGGDYVVEHSTHPGIVDLMRQLGHTVPHAPEVDRL